MKVVTKLQLLQIARRNKVPDSEIYTQILSFRRNVALVLLKSKNLLAPEEVELRLSPPSVEENDIAFKAKVFDVTEFQEDTIEISLQQTPDKRRRKRNAVVVEALSPMSTYRAAQLNTDESEVG